MPICFFEHRESNGFYRYLLTMLDGLESAGAPDTRARAEILRERLRQAPPPLGAADIDAIADASHGLTGADLRAVVEDGMLLFAHSKARGEAARQVEEFFWKPSRRCAATGRTT